ncbi:pentapeptide repeat-containing protein [Nocardioides sp. NPDC101246]|uniref:pentapeptide repeat-containing protein n=1 Tax=Nocardioides sp. NPDC101246 TaxID=3364336 RepID=UPI00380F7FFF
METFTIRDTRVTLPALDERDLQAVSTLETADDPITYFSFRDQALRLLEVVDSRLHDGLIQKVATERTHIAGVRLSSVEFADCELDSLAIADSRLSRVRFSNCRLLGARFSEVTMEDVVFERCRLDYATFTHVVAKGAVAFVGCSLAEAEFDGSDLSRAAFTENRLTQTRFGPGTYRGTDLRGNDLPAISGVVNLRQALLDRHQLADLTGALAHDLDLTFTDDLE